MQYTALSHAPVVSLFRGLNSCSLSLMDIITRQYYMYKITYTHENNFISNLSI